jgi:predicted dehydrogenase
LKFHFDRYNPLLVPNNTKKRLTNAGAGILKDLGLLIDQAVYLFGFPQSVYADIRTTREHSLVDDGLTFYCIIPMSAPKASFVREANPAYTIHGKGLS